jgi:hypothetical protein
VPGLWDAAQSQGPRQPLVLHFVWRLYVLESEGWSIATASGERPRHSGRCRLCSPSRSPQSFSLWNRSGPLWCPTG